MAKLELPSRAYLIKELERHRRRFEVVLEAYRQAESNLEFEYSGTGWTREDALAQLKEELEEADRG